MEVGGVRVSWRWMVLVLRGAVAIAAGIAAFAISVDAAKLLLACYFFLDGALTLVFAVRLHAAIWTRALIAVDGAIDLVVAVLLAAFVPSIALLILVVSLWAIATGILEVIAAVFVRRIPALSWGIALVGVASCAAGIVMLDWRNLAEIGLLYAFAAYALIAGILFVTLGIVLARAFHRVRT
jgi:uncharacterized membrane protein HdeD (DUF308 family)